MPSILNSLSIGDSGLNAAQVGINTTGNTITNAAIHRNETTSVQFSAVELEYFSVSKAISACGWRLGAAVGSKDFISELTTIKGNADSGPFGPALVGCEEYFGMPESKQEMKEIQKMYERRLDIALTIFADAGFELACPTDAGFFMLFHCPKTVNGKTIENAEAFNQFMIKELGVVGVPFTGAEISGKPEQFIRYSVCSDFENTEVQEKVKTALAKIEIGYYKFQKLKYIFQSKTHL